MESAIKPRDAVTAYRLDKCYEPGGVVVFSRRGRCACVQAVALTRDKVDIDKDGLISSGNHQFEATIFKRVPQRKAMSPSLDRSRRGGLGTWR